MEVCALLLPEQGPERVPASHQGASPRGDREVGGGSPAMNEKQGNEGVKMDFESELASGTSLRD